MYWDDAVIMVNTKQACMRYCDNEDFDLFKTHEKKDKEGLESFKRPQKTEMNIPKRNWRRI